MVAYEIPAVGPAEVNVLSALASYGPGPEDDPPGTDGAALRASRQRLLSFATVIIPGHGAPFRSGAASGRGARD